MAINYVEISGALSPEARLIISAINNLIMQLNNGGIGGESIAPRIITNVMIAENAVESENIAVAAIGTAHIQDAAIGNAQIDLLSANRVMIGEANIVSCSANSLTAGVIDATEIDVIKLNAKNITTGELDADLVTIKNLKADSITGGTLDCKDITVKNLKAQDLFVDTINGYQISKGAITGGDTALNAWVDLGTGTDGKVHVICPAGSGGNYVTVQVIAGSGNNTPITLSYGISQVNPELKLMTIALATNSVGAPNDSVNTAANVAAAIIQASATQTGFPRGFKATLLQAGVVKPQAAVRCEHGEDGNIAPGTITGQNIAFIEADYIQGGQLVLGGKVGESTYDGLILIKDASGTTLGRIDKIGVHYYDSNGISTLDATANGIYFGNKQGTVAPYSTTARIGLGLYAAVPG